jgi:hypothetical protein
VVDVDSYFPKIVTVMSILAKFAIVLYCIRKNNNQNGRLKYARGQMFSP